MQKKSNELIFESLNHFDVPYMQRLFFFLSYEEYDNLAENQIISLDQQAM